MDAGTAGQLSLGVLAGIVIVALLFDFMNGFHDAANSIATVVSTGVLKPYQAVVLAAFFNFVAVFVFHLSVATTVGKGIVDQGIVELEWERIWNIEPILFDDALVGLADEAIREVVGSSHRLPSGPLHDAAGRSTTIWCWVPLSAPSPGTSSRGTTAFRLRPRTP